MSRRPEKDQKSLHDLKGRYSRINLKPEGIDFFKDNLNLTDTQLSQKLFDNNLLEFTGEFWGRNQPRVPGKTWLTEKRQELGIERGDVTAKTGRTNTEISFLQEVYPNISGTISHLKLGDKPTIISRIHTSGGGAFVMPPKGYLKVFEKVRQGEITEAQAARELQMTRKKEKVKDKAGTIGIYDAPTTPFENIFTAWLKKNPFPEELTPDIKVRDKQVKPFVIKRTLDLIEKAKADKSDNPFNVKFFNAFRESRGVLPGEGMFQKTRMWDNTRAIAEQLTGENLLIGKGRYDVKTGTLFPENTKMDAFKDGDILTGDARTWARNMESNQTSFFRKEIKLDPEAMNLYDIMYDALPKNEKTGNAINKYWNVDHIQAISFNGKNNNTNLRFTLAGQHIGKALPPEKTPPGVDQPVAMKTGFDNQVYKANKAIIDAVKNKDETTAALLSKQVEILVDNFKKTNPKVDFIVGDPFVYVKNSKIKNEFENISYAEKTLTKEEQKIAKKYIKQHEHLPNKGQTLNESIKVAFERLIPIIDMHGGKLPVQGRVWTEFNKGGYIPSSLVSMEEVFNGIY